MNDSDRNSEQEFIRETADRLREYGGFEDVVEWLVEGVDDES
mgnify:CR=1 FL=1